ncbi:hypothetical protein [Actinospica acidiphila]|uniref:hypothetical protein n=1 Tax=Actinospica acidiphila TaxID=304899 RepID=UPI00256FDB0E|nr:hypothetical protein [Actinospica acidiphila]
MRSSVTEAPFGSAGPTSRQNGGSSAAGYTPPALGLPSTTKITTDSAMPTGPSRTWKAMPAAAAANVVRAPIHQIAAKWPVRASKTWSTMIAPPSPDSTDSTASAPSRIVTRCRSGGLAPYEADAAAEAR